jgi:hypothetical protein
MHNENQIEKLPWVWTEAARDSGRVGARASITASTNR